jgi:hypothetical protein
MNYLKSTFLLVISIFCATVTFAQTSLNGYANQSSDSNNWFISYHIGVQLSGIKKEDFVYNNYSPQVTVNIGRVITPEVSLRIGYKGIYFNYIEDEFKHYYNYFYGETVFNLNQILKKSINKFEIQTFVGAGYFYNYTYGHPIISSNVGIDASFDLTKRLEMTVDISAIMGWDIYQGDEDIIPSHSYGIKYYF